MLFNFSNINDARKVLEQGCESLQILDVFVGFDLCNLNIFLQFGEGRDEGGLVLLQEFENFFDALTVQLFTDGVQIFSLLRPEFDFS